jgi:hypothetical protein
MAAITAISPRIAGKRGGQSRLATSTCLSDARDGRRQKSTMFTVGNQHPENRQNVVKTT